MYSLRHRQKKHEREVNERINQDLQAFLIEAQKKREQDFKFKDASDRETRKFAQKDMVREGKAQENIKPFSIGTPSFNAEVKHSTSLFGTKSALIIKPKNVPVSVDDLVATAKAAYEAGLKQDPPKRINFNVNGFAHPAGTADKIRAELAKMKAEVDEKMQAEQLAKEPVTLEATKPVLTATSNPAAANPANDPNGKTPALTKAYTSEKKKDPSLAKLVIVNKPKPEKEPTPTKSPTLRPT